MLTNRASARYRLKAPTPGEMGPPLISRPAPSICVSSPGPWRPATHFSESTTEKEISRVTSQVSSFFTPLKATIPKTAQPAFVHKPVNKHNKYMNSLSSDRFLRPLLPETTFFSPEVTWKAEDKDIICTHARSLAVWVFELPKKKCVEFSFPRIGFNGCQTSAWGL